MPGVAPVRTPNSRLFTIEDRAGPANAPMYVGWGKVTATSWSLGDRTPVRVPSDKQYGSFNTVDAIKGEKGLPTGTIENRYAYTRSDFLRYARKGCPLDVQVHFGKCQDVRDFNGGWDKILAYDDVDLSSWDTSDLGALDQGEDAVVNETMPFNAQDMYEIKKMLMQQVAESEIVQEIVDVTICDAMTCGVCGIPSDGCQKVFALTLSAGGSPGLPAEIIYSSDGMATIGETNISTLPANQDPSAMACAGVYLVVVSNGDCAIHYAPISDILDAAETWARIATGLVCAAGAPNDLFTLSGAQIWIVGDGGYVYFSGDITAGVSVQDAGIATTEDLNAIHGWDEENLVAVGDNNAVILTRNGGTTWTSLTGPAVGIDLNTIWMRSDIEWFVGAANGSLYYTRNGGVTWTEKAFPGSGAGSVRDIVFATPTVGYMAHNTAVTAGRILRTISGGNSWYVLPEGTSPTIPANDYVAALAACSEDPNLVYGGGLDDDASDGILIKAA